MRKEELSEMDMTGLILGFVPVASATVGAGATYLWQTLGNRRIDEAVRIQTNARLLEALEYLARFYYGWMHDDDIPTARRLAASFDDMQIALAFRDRPETLHRIAQIRVFLEVMPGQTAQVMKARYPHDKDAFEIARRNFRYIIGSHVALVLDTFTDRKFKLLAESSARANQFYRERHENWDPKTMQFPADP